MFMRLNERLGRIEQAMLEDNEHCGCVGGWQVEYYRQGERAPEPDQAICEQCGKPRGLILVRVVSGPKDKVVENA